MDALLTLNMHWNSEPSQTRWGSLRRTPSPLAGDTPPHCSLGQCLRCLDRQYPQFGFYKLSTAAQRFSALPRRVFWLGRVRLLKWRKCSSFEREKMLKTKGGVLRLKYSPFSKCRNTRLPLSIAVASSPSMQWATGRMAAYMSAQGVPTSLLVVQSRSNPLYC